jgi:hypothetical protein
MSRHELSSEVSVWRVPRIEYEIFTALEQSRDELVCRAKSVPFPLIADMGQRGSAVQKLVACIGQSPVGELYRKIHKNDPFHAWFLVGAVTELINPPLSENYLPGVIEGTRRALEGIPV